ncbi:MULTISPECIES: hypothetical protein, partial [unclassified Serratia (in: enterobacteria)]|uniref:hypothetical protein n=1 Tax=unclassified Serratia (in: enterobacteria) TaxID=2647522 RepID=UPI001E3BA3AD
MVANHVLPLTVRQKVPFYCHLLATVVKDDPIGIEIVSLKNAVINLPGKPFGHRHLNTGSCIQCV